MKLKSLISIFITGSIYLLLLTSLVSCRSVFKGYNGLTVPAENLIVLQTEGSSDGKWETEDISVNYLYTKNADQLKISGRIDFDDSLKYNFNHLYDFTLWVHFINSDNIIVGNLIISPFTFFDQLEETSFEKNVTLPPDTQAIVFSYSGNASDDSTGGHDRQDGGGSWIFWSTPQG
jgi:lipopolysaccharide assembly outer membrane protein LptD (OstA)